MTEAKSIAQQLGEFKTDEQWLQAEIARLNKSSIVPLEHVRDLHGWLDEILREAAIKSLSRGFKKIDKKVLQEVAREYS